MLITSALGGRHLDYSFRTRGGAPVRIIERPGRWMAADELARIVEDLRTVVRSSIDAGSLDYGVVSGRKDRLDDAVLTIVHSHEDGRPVAFNALSVMECELRGKPVEVLHLGLVMIDPAYRAKGVSGILYGLTCFLIFARRQMRPLWVSNVTQVPSVFGMVGENFGNVYPRPGTSARRSFDHLSLARQIMTRHRHVFGVGNDAWFDERRFVIANAYTGGSDNLKKTFDEAPKHRRAEFNEMCARELDYERGDDFLQIGQFDLASARSYFTRSLPAISPVNLAYQFVFLFLESLVAPVLQWFSASQPMGELRAWGEGAR
jgi:hypothetical protein